VGLGLQRVTAGRRNFSPEKRPKLALFSDKVLSKSAKFLNDISRLQARNGLVVQCVCPARVRFRAKPCPELRRKFARFRAPTAGGSGNGLAGFSTFDAEETKSRAQRRLGSILSHVSHVPVRRHVRRNPLRE